MDGIETVSLPVGREGALSLCLGCVNTDPGERPHDTLSWKRRVPYEVVDFLVYLGGLERTTLCPCHATMVHLRQQPRVCELFDIVTWMIQGGLPSPCRSSRGRGCQVEVSPSGCSRYPRPSGPSPSLYRSFFFFPDERFPFFDDFFDPRHFTKYTKAC